MGIVMAEVLDTAATVGGMRALAQGSPNAPLKVLVISALFPWNAAPAEGVFVKERIKQLRDRYGADIRVVSPKPYFPPIRWFRRWYLFSQVKPYEEVDGLPVHYARYFFIPKMGGYFHPWFMFPSAWSKIKRLSRDFQPDLLDAHFVFPSGVLAEAIARRLKRPLVITGRGVDMLSFAKLPFVRWQIERALRRSMRLIAVSRQIETAMVECGANPSRITVIPNGVDLEAFRVIDKAHARQVLGLPMERPIALTVGYRIPVKGFDIFIDAIGRLKQFDYSVLGLIVGGPPHWRPDCGPQLELQIRRAALENHVKLAGYRPHDELALWYAASDVFVLLSSREGSPNVVMEALACGTPVVAARVGGIADLLDGKEFAVLLSERTSHAAAMGIKKFLQAPPDRSEIRRFAESHSWEVTAARVYEVWKQALLDYHQDKLPP